VCIYTYMCVCINKHIHVEYVCIYMYIYTYINIYIYIGRGGTSSALRVLASRDFVFTRYCFPLKLYCGSQSSFHCPTPPAKPTLLQYECTIIAQYTPPHRPTPPLCHTCTILMMAISCKGQVETGSLSPLYEWKYI